MGGNACRIRLIFLFRPFVSPGKRYHAAFRDSINWGRRKAGQTVFLGQKKMNL